MSTIVKRGPYKHGFASSGNKHRFYNCYIAAKARCNQRSYARYDRYGGRGIKFTWDSFQSFHADMFSTYLEHSELYGEKETTLERIDRDGHYSRENCRWATRKEQARNRISNKFLTYKGETKPYFQWEEDLGLKPKTITHALHKGKTIKQIFGF